MGVTIDGSQGLDTDNTELTLEVGGSEKARIDSSGNVGIGTSSPASPSHTKGTSSTGFYGNVVSTFEDSSNNYPALAFKGTSGHLFGMRCEGGESMTFATTPSGTSWNPVMRMDADGLKFNGDTASANALDDYEEGTWTPTLSGGTSANDLQYTKIGNVVHIAGTITFNSVSGSGNLVIGGLPFTAKSFTDGYQSLNAHPYKSLNIGSPYVYQTMRVNNGSTNLQIVAPTYDGTYRTFGAYSHVSGGTFSFRVSGSYIAG